MKLVKSTELRLEMITPIRGRKEHGSTEVNDMKKIRNDNPDKGTEVTYSEPVNLISSM